MNWTGLNLPCHSKSQLLDEMPDNHTAVTPRNIDDIASIHIIILYFLNLFAVNKWDGSQIIRSRQASSNNKTHVKYIFTM